MHQVHGDDAVLVGAPGPAGEADAMVTAVPGLPLAVFTADCLGVVITGDRGVGVAHAGWRGMAAGVLGRTVAVMRDNGMTPVAAYVGPHIGACCFEVGSEVAERLPDSRSQTSRQTLSVDLFDAARRQLDPLPLWAAGRCSRHDPGHHSHRGSGTPARMAAIGWVPAWGDHP
ncbi:MAG: polyphenol oxidase family protein [Acidimicrobiia bacterium]